MNHIIPEEVKGDVTFRNVISEVKPANEIVKLADKEKVD